MTTVTVRSGTEQDVLDVVPDPVSIVTMTIRVQEERHMTQPVEKKARSGRNPVDPRVDALGWHADRLGDAGPEGLDDDLAQLLATPETAGVQVQVQQVVQPELVGGGLVPVDDAGDPSGARRHEEVAWPVVAVDPAAPHRAAQERAGQLAPQSFHASPQPAASPVRTMGELLEPAQRQVHPRRYGRAVQRPLLRGPGVQVLDQARGGVEQRRRLPAAPQQARALLAGQRLLDEVAPPVDLALVHGPGQDRRPVLEPRVARERRQHLDLPSEVRDRKSTGLNSSHGSISYA